MLVERVEAFCAHADWMRAYSEIDDFEKQTSAEEQLCRFRDRERTSSKAAPWTLVERLQAAL